eukprot:1142733-Pelagomonas_calceolata.AAC.2
MLNPCKPPRPPGAPRSLSRQVKSTQPPSAQVQSQSKGSQSSEVKTSAGVKVKAEVQSEWCRNSKQMKTVEVRSERVANQAVCMRQMSARACPACVAKTGCQKCKPSRRRNTGGGLMHELCRVPATSCISCAGCVQPN